MLRITPCPIGQMDFSPYGMHYPLSPFVSGQFDSSLHSCTSIPVMVQPMRLGLTSCGGGTFLCRQMERHISTQELLFAGDKPLVLVVANSDPFGKPQAQDLVAVSIGHGDLVVLHPGIWHDACRCLQGETVYYFMANNDGSPQEVQWIPIAPQPVEIWIEED